MPTPALTAIASFQVILFCEHDEALLREVVVDAFFFHLITHVILLHHDYFVLDSGSKFNEIEFMQNRL